MAVPENNGAVHTVARIIETVVSIHGGGWNLGALYIDRHEKAIPDRDIYSKRWDVIDLRPAMQNRQLRRVGCRR